MSERMELSFSNTKVMGFIDNVSMNNDKRLLSNITSPLPSQSSTFLPEQTLRLCSRTVGSFGSVEVKSLS